MNVGDVLFAAQRAAVLAGAEKRGSKVAVLAAYRTCVEEVRQRALTSKSLDEWRVLQEAKEQLQAHIETVIRRG